MTIRCTAQRLVALICLLVCGTLQSATYYLPDNGDPRIGEIQSVVSEEGDTLASIARRFGVGYRALLAANPGLKQGNLNTGQQLTIPSQHILPSVPYQGLVVNLPEMRIYYFPSTQTGQRAVVSTYPIGIGKEGYTLPPLLSRITQKSINPVWRVPTSIQVKQPYLPEVMAAGPNNPLGNYAMRLNNSSYLIHGTNQPDTIGQRISNGCIRMYPEDIEWLFPMIPSGTAVRIINQPVKIAWLEHDIYVESHRPLAEAGHEQQTTWDELDAQLENAERRLDLGSLNRINQLVLSYTGLPARIHTTDPALWTASKDTQQR